MVFGPPDTGRPPRVAVLGAGAIGIYYGSRLALAGADVHFLARADYETARRAGYLLKMTDGERRLEPAQVYRSTEEIGPCDLVVIACKVTANDSIQERIPPLLGEGTALLALQNGMGSADCFSAAFPDHPVLQGLCFICLNRTAPAVVENSYPGYIVIGEAAGGRSALGSATVAWLERAGVNPKHAESLDDALWRKLCWNVPFNGLAIALGGVTTEAIMASPDRRAIARGLMAELQAAAAACGHVIPDAFLDKMMENTAKMGAYKPSSMIDFLEGRVVEVEAIWGEPLRRGRKAGVAMPRLELLHAVIAAVAGGVS